MTSASTIGLFERVSNQFLPKATIFTNTTGEFAKYFFKNNPWKLSSDNDYNKIYRFCIICGANRFTEKEWKALDSMKGGPPTICKQTSCYKALEFVPKFIPRKHYMIETAGDQSLVKNAKATECFEQLDAVTSHIRFDKVFASDQEMPLEYLETFKQLERLPVETRIPEIDRLYFSFLEKNNISKPEHMLLADATDPFLKKLVAYRQKSIEILKSLESRSVLPLSYPGLQGRFKCTLEWEELQPVRRSFEADDRIRFMRLSSITPNSFLDEIRVLGIRNGSFAVQLVCKASEKDMFYAYLFQQGIKGTHNTLSRCLFNATTPSECNWALNFFNNNNEISEPEYASFIRRLIHGESWLTAQREMTCKSRSLL